MYKDHKFDNDRGVDMGMNISKIEQQSVDQFSDL